MKLIVGILFLTTTSFLFGASESVKKNELFVFSGVSVLGKDARYENRFVPFSVAIGDGVQIINLEDESRPVWGLGLTHHFSKRWGIQAIVQYQKRDLTSNSNEASVQSPAGEISEDNTIIMLADKTASLRIAVKVFWPFKLLLGDFRGITQTVALFDDQTLAVDNRV